MGTQHLKHNVLQGLLVGDTVDVDSDIGGKIFIRSQGGIACLSVAGKLKFEALLPIISQAKVIALVRRKTNPESK